MCNEVKMGLGSRFKREYNQQESILNDFQKSSVEPEHEIVDFDCSVSDVDFVDEIEQIPDSNLSIFDDCLQLYVSDKDVFKIVIIDNQLKIFHQNGVIESIPAPPSYKEKIRMLPTGVFRYVENGCMVFGITPPISKKTCITIKKIEILDKNEFLQCSGMSKKAFDFVVKAIASKKNILIVDNDDSLTLMNTIVNFVLADNSNILLQEIEKLKANPLTTALCVDRLSKDEFSSVVSVALDIEADYFIADLTSDSKMSTLLSLTHDLKGKIYSIASRNAQTALFKILNLVMNAEHCNEKIAKSTLLHSFDYIIAQNSVYVITPAKTAVIMLKALPE